MEYFKILIILGGLTLFKVGNKDTEAIYELWTVFV